MSRIDITNFWDRDMRNAINNNFIKLFNEYIGAGLNAEEARNKALDAVATSDLAKQTAEQANLTSEQVRLEMNNIIREQTAGGDIVPEVVSARGNEATLGERLNSTDANLAQKADDDEVRKKSVPIGLNDADSDLLGAIQNKEGETTFNLLSVPRQRSVTPGTTVFVKPGKNKFDGTFVNAILNGSTTYYFNDDATAKCAIVEVKTGTQYTITKSNDTDRFRVAAFSGYPTSGATSTNGTQSDSATTRNITTNETQNYLVIYVSTDGSEPAQLQVEEGAFSTEYEEPNTNLYIPLGKKSFPDVDVDMTTFARRGRNLFNGQFDNRLIRTDASAGQFYNSTTSRTTKRMEAEPNEYYTVSGGNANVFRFEDENGQYISYVDSPTAQAPSNAKYMYVFYSSHGFDAEKVQIERGQEATAYTPYDAVVIELDPASIPGATAKTNFIISGNLDAEYQPTATAPVMTSALTSDVVYTKYDEFVANHPAHWSRTLGTNETTGLPVYQYEYVPEQLKNYNEVYPEILVITGTHGDEKQSIAATMRFFEDLTENWQGNELLKTLRRNLKFTVIPCLNVWGVDNHSRDNANGVNINRDFPEDWSEGTDTGTTPLSQPESQYIQNLLESEKDIMFAIDFHRYNPYSQDDYTMWVGTKNLQMNKYLAGWAREMDIDFKEAHPEVVTEGEPDVAIQENYTIGGQGWMAFSFIENGIPGTILEISSDSAFNDYHTHAFGHLLAYATKHLHNDKSNWL